jgi:hypothetical protein
MSAGPERCPLGCGAVWHGLPIAATYRNDTCPGPYGVPVPVVEVDPEAVEGAMVL